MKKVFQVLNQPFTLWFLSSILVGTITWQYNEIQKVSSQNTETKRILIKSKLELKLILQDIRFFVSAKENITAGALNRALLLMQYNGQNPMSPNYISTLQNIMLEIDSRSGSKGINIYQSKLYEYIKVISSIQVRLIKKYTLTNDKLWNDITENERNKLAELSELTKEMLEYYKNS